MVVQSFQTREEAEDKAGRLRDIGLPVSVIRVRQSFDGRTERVWQVVVPYDYAIYAGRRVPPTQEDDESS